MLFSAFDRTKLFIDPIQIFPGRKSHLKRNVRSSSGLLKEDPGKKLYLAITAEMFVGNGFSLGRFPRTAPY